MPLTLSVAPCAAIARPSTSASFASRLVHEGVARPRQQRRHEVGAAAVQGALADLFARAAPEPVEVVRVDDVDACRIGGIACLADMAGGTLGVLEQLLGVGERVVAKHVDDQEERAVVPGGHSHVRYPFRNEPSRATAQRTTLGGAAVGVSETARGQPLALRGDE